MIPLLLRLLALLLAIHPAADPAKTTTTKQWVCIRSHESTDGKLSPNLYQFQNADLERTVEMTRPPSTYSRSQQNAFALKAYAYSLRVWGNGFTPWAADSTACDLGVNGE